MCHPYSDMLPLRTGHCDIVLLKVSVEPRLSVTWKFKCELTLVCFGVHVSENCQRCEGFLSLPVSITDRASWNPANCTSSSSHSEYVSTPNHFQDQHDGRVTLWSGRECFHISCCYISLRNKLIYLYLQRNIKQQHGD